MPVETGGFSRLRFGVSEWDVNLRLLTSVSKEAALVPRPRTQAQWAANLCAAKPSRIERLDENALFGFRFHK